MLVMRIMGMFMLVIHSHVNMCMNVFLREMKPQSDRHQGSRDYEPGTEALVQESNGENGAAEWSQGIVGSSTCRAETS